MKHFTEIHQLIENQQIAIGFVSNLHKYPNVTAQPLFTESMILLYHRCMFETSRNLMDLPPQDEIYLTIGGKYELWHRSRLPNSDERTASIGMNSMLPDFLRCPQTWAITTQGTVETLLAQNNHLRSSSITKDPPPHRMTYLLLYKYPKPWVDDLCRLFLADVVESIKKKPYLKLLYHLPADDRH